MTQTFSILPRLPRPVYRFAPLLLLAVTFAGCNAPSDNGNGDDLEGGDDHHDVEPAAGSPWWDVGRYWDMTVTRGASSESFHLVNFHNDTDHFWLGVQDRDQAMAMALWDTNPFLGRIHHGSIAPHEAGQHAIMYQFPLRDGAQWQGFLLGRVWNFEAREAQSGRFDVEGLGIQGEAVTYDYDPDSQWFTRLEERDRDGKLVWQAVVTESGSGARGEYVFLRGRNYYETGGVVGTKEASFSVDDDLTSLALHAGIASSGPVSIRITDADGDLAHQWTLGPGGGSVNETVEVANPADGTWDVDILATNGFTGKLYVTGIIEAKGRA